MGRTISSPTLSQSCKTTRSSENDFLNGSDPSPQRRQNNRFLDLTGITSNNQNRQFVNSVDSLPLSNTEFQQLEALQELNKKENKKENKKDNYIFEKHSRFAIPKDEWYDDRSCWYCDATIQQPKKINYSPHKDRYRFRRIGRQAAKHQSQVKQMVAQGSGLIGEMNNLRETISNVSDAIGAVTEMMTRVKKAVQFDEEDNTMAALFSRLEGLILLIFDLNSRSSLKDMVIPVLQYIKSWQGSTSLTETVCKWAKQILTEKSDGSSLDDDDFFSTVEGPLNQQAGWFSKNWQALTDGPFGRRLASLINFLIISGLAPETVSNKLTVEVYKAVHVAAERKKNPSIFHHLFGTLDWMADCVIPAISTGNLSLLLTDADTDEVDQAFRNSLDAVHLNVTGQMKLCKEKYGIADEAELLVYLTNTSLSILTLKKRTDDSVLVRELNHRLITMDKIAADVQAHWHEAGLRVKPYAVYIYGGSSLGKSVLAGIISHAICAVNGFPQGKEYVCTINGSDKYQSDFRSQHICVIFDDMGNTKPEKCEGNPLFVLIQFINNMHCSALSPEADKKGKMDIRSKIVIVTSNTADLHASFFSVNPSSIMRRFDLVVDVRLKDDSVAPDGGLHPRHAGNPQPDAWVLNIGKVCIKRNPTETHKDDWNVIPIKEDASVVDLVDYLAETTPSYYEKQEKIVESSTDMHLKKHCEDHPLFTLPCAKCEAAKKVLLRDFDNYLTKIEQDKAPPLKAEAGPFSFLSKVERDKNGEAVLNQFSEVTMQSMVTVPTYEDYARGMEDYPCHKEGDGFAHAHPGFGEAHWKRRLKRLLVVKFPPLREAVHKLRRDVDIPAVCKVLAVAAGFGLTAFAINRYFNPPPMIAEGAVLSRIQMASSTPRQIVERDNKYHRVYTNSQDLPNASVSTTLNQIEGAIDRNLHIVTIQEFDETVNKPIGAVEWCNSFPIGGTEWLITGHQFKKDITYRVEFMTQPNPGVKRFVSLVNSTNSRPVLGTDAVILNLPAGGDTKRFIDYMLDDFDPEVIKSGTPIFVYHAHKSVIQDKDQPYVAPSEYKICTKIKAIANIEVKGVGTYFGIDYEAENHNGMCGSMIFTATRNPVLIGMHSAGLEGTKRCGAVLLHKKALLETKKAFEVTVAETTPLRTSIYGVDVSTTTDVHAHNAIHFLESEEMYNLEAFGQTKLPQSRFNSDVQPSIIQKELILAGFEVKDTKPPKSAVRPTRHRHMTGVTKIKPPANPKYIKLAQGDFIAKIDAVCLGENHDFLRFVHPLSYDDALNGVPGVKGFEPINPNTSINFPLSGPKHKFLMECEALKHEFGLETKRFVRVEVDANGDKQFIYELNFDPAKADVREETETLLSLMANGQRANVTFKTHCKDAPISFKKAANNKIRIISGAPVAMVIVSRCLTLALINAMTYFPTIFESAVGIDAAGKDWQFLADYLQSMSGGIRCGDGDHKDYDLDIRPDFSKPSFEILKHILVKADFPQDLLDVYDGFATECIYPVYESSGFIFKAFGSGPSGHPLTVVINGLVGCLYLRYAYYSMHAKQLPEGQSMQLGTIPYFHERVALITYGDDNNFDTHPDEPLFNMISAHDELALIGISYTDANKKVSEVPFKTIDEISFLKRTFHVHPELKARVGALDLDSVNRSLLFSKGLPKGSVVSMAEITAGNMSQALSEAYLHGEGVYKEYANLFSTLLDVVDEEGFKIRDYYRPPSVEDLKARYESTVCCYPEALARLSGPREPQSGLWQDEDEDMSEAGSVDSEEDYGLYPPTYVLLRYLSRLGHDHEFMEHNLPHELCEYLRRAYIAEDDVDREYCEAAIWYCFENNTTKGPTNVRGTPRPYTFVRDVKFRIWCATKAKHISDFEVMRLDHYLFGEDCRLSNFTALVRTEASEIVGRRIARSVLNASMKYICDRVDSSLIGFSNGEQPRAISLVRCLRRKEVALDVPIPPELVDHIWSFLQPEMVPTPITADGLEVFVTPNYDGLVLPIQAIADEMIIATGIKIVYDMFDLQVPTIPLVAR